jgi:signal transduction protein with GAF and PtsI domain
MVKMTNPTALFQQERQRMKEEIRTLREEVDSFRQFMGSLDNLFDQLDQFSSNNDLFPLLKTLLMQAMKLLNAPDGSLALLDDEAHELEFVIVEGKLADQLTHHRIPANEGIMGWVVQHRRPTFVRDTRTDARFSNRIDQTFTFTTQSIAAAPLLGGGKVLGVIEVLNQPGADPFSESDVALLKLLCRAAGEALAYIEKIPEA